MKNYIHVKAKLLKDRETRRRYDELKPEFVLIRMLIKKRLARGLTQSDLARRVGTKQSAISRLESGTYNPTMSILRKVARALDADLNISIR